MNENTFQKGDFPQTRWTLVRRASSPHEPESLQALNELCESYWYALYAFVRSQGAPPEDAADEVQGFFAALLEKDFFGAADQEKGKLRSYLISGIKKYRSNEYRARQTQKRGGGMQHLSIDHEWAEGRFEADPVDGMTPEQILDRSWSLLVLEKVMAKLADSFTRSGKEKEFTTLSPFLAWNSGEGDYTDTAAKLGTSVSNVKVKIHRMRARYRQFLEQEVLQTLDSPNEGDVDVELRHLLASLG